MSGRTRVDIVRLAEITVVILVPGMGDDVQTIKAGIMEIADIFVINKSDRDGAERVEREIRALQSLATRHDGWTPPIVKTVASEGIGIEELADAVDRVREAISRKTIGHLRKASKTGRSGWWKCCATSCSKKHGRAGRRKGNSVGRRKSPSTSAIRIRWWKRLLRKRRSGSGAFRF